MLSKARIKFIKSLQLKKYRKQEQCFTVEGAKSVQELLVSDFDVMDLVATQSFLDDSTEYLKSFKGEVMLATERELEEISEFRTNQAALAVARLKVNEPFKFSATQEYILALDEIQDPGNLGTIIRTADWYGIHKIVASEQTADFYNSKVIQASMGSFTRVRLFYTNLASYLSGLNTTIYGAFLEGDDVHSMKFSQGGVLVIGNEGNGISKDVGELVTRKITIPKYGSAESLNAGMAAGIICDNIRRSLKG